MKDEQALVPVVEQLPASSNVSLDVLDEFATGSSFLPRMQLFTKGKYIDTGKIQPGHYGVIDGEEVIDLGITIDVYILGVRTKALDMSDRDNIISRYTAGEDEFERIRQQSEVKNSSCQCGLAFLVYESATNQMYEFFCGSKSARAESKKMIPFLAITPEQAAAAAEKGRIVEPKSATPMTLKVRYIQKQFSWHVPVAIACSSPIEIAIPTDKVLAEIEKFLNPSDEGGTTVEAPEAGGRAV